MQSQSLERRLLHEIKNIIIPILIFYHQQQQVYFLCDSVGGLFTFQALCQNSSRDDDFLSSGGSSTYEDEDTSSIDSARSGPLNFRFTINGVFTLGSPIGMVALKQKNSTMEKGLFGILLLYTSLSMFFFIKVEF